MLHVFWISTTPVMSKLAAAVCSLDSMIAVNNWFVLNAYVMHLVLPFIHLHIASHLGTLDEPREGRDVGAKPKDLV